MKKVISLFILLLLAIAATSQPLLNTKYINLATASSPVNINLASDVDIFSASGIRTLSAGFSISVTGTPVDGKTIFLFWDGTSLTTAGNTVTLMGVALTDMQAKKKLIVLSIYRGSLAAWETRVINDAKSTYWLGKDQIDTTNFSNGTTIKAGISGVSVGDTSLGNGQLKANADIAMTKLASLTATRVPVTNASGKLTTSAVTPTELGHLTGVTSAIQTQINTKATTGAIVNASIDNAAAIAYSKLNLTNTIVAADINASAAIPYSKLALTGTIVNADLGAAAAIAMTKLAALTASRVPVTDGSGFITSSSVTPTELGYLSGVTSNIQTQISAISLSKVTYSALTTTTTLTAATLKNNIVAQSLGGGYDVVLPLANTVTSGTFVEIMMAGPNTCHVKRGGADNLFSAYGAVTTTDTLTITKRGAMYVSDGSGQWTVVRKY